LNTLTTRGFGGLEHLYSTLISTGPNPDPSHPTWSSFIWLKFVSHEYFHTFNVKRLRPIELGPFDYERPPRTPSLWISEGLTSYYGDLIVCRSGLASTEDFLGSMSSYIRQLQNTPGRLKQSLSQASLDVWTSSMSGMVRNTDEAVSYYIKGPVVGFLLDARIRRVTDGQRSLDDVMRTAYDRYSGPQGFTPQEFVAVAEEVAGVDLDDWFHDHLDSTKELDYSEALDWFGLRISDGADPKTGWTLSVRPDASDKQRSQLLDLTTSPSASTAPK
jgi:predicted metalloprotease with PDZ domain